jgi:hypothetical protein
MKKSLLDKKGALLIASPFALMLVGLLIASAVNFTPSLTPSENEIVALTFDSVVLNKRKYVDGATLNNPIVMPAAGERNDFPGVPLSDIVPLTPSGAKEKLSLIFIKAGKRMAIIDGLVVREGDIIRDGRIGKIEKDRVYIKGKEEGVWLMVD